jgi:hypothetical protein
MGSFLSTRWGGRARRRTVEEAVFALRARDARAVIRSAVHPARQVDSAELDGRPTARVTIECIDVDHWLLIVRRPLQLQDRIVLERRRYHRTAVWLLRCPWCDSPRRSLYVPPPNGRLQCRACANLGYFSQRLAPLDRARFLTRRTARRLGVECSSVDLPKVQRWRGLRRRTFRAWQELLNTQAAKWDHLFLTGTIRLLRGAERRDPR